MTVLTTASSVLPMIAVPYVRSAFITPPTINVFKIVPKLPTVILNTVSNAPLMSLTTEHSVMPVTLAYNHLLISYPAPLPSVPFLTANFVSQEKKWAAFSVHKSIS